MNGYERTKAMLEGRPVDHLPLTPITMMFAADQVEFPTENTRETTESWSKPNCIQQRNLVLTR